MQSNITKLLAILTATPLLLSIASCGGGGNSNPTGITVSNCSIDGQNQFVYEVMNDLYLYYDQIPTVNPNDYDSPSALLKDLIVETDRFSFIANQQTQQAFYEEGTYNGIGFSYESNENFYTIKFVYDDSSAGRAGLQRGDKITSINDISITQINDDGGLSTFLSNVEDGEIIVFSVTASNSETTKEIEVSKGLVTINTVLEAQVITANSTASNANDTKVGYLAFTSFISPSTTELTTAFKKFKQEKIDELVLDLRYNGGGRIDVAQTLASYIAGDKALGADTSKLIYNDKNSHLNSNFPFQKLDDAVDLDRLYVLTLEGTCSASELVVNAMQPVGVEVVTIGQTSCGKPLGSRNIDFCDKTLSAISFDVVNDSNQGEYINGITPTCAVNDDFSELLSDPKEAMFATALYHIENDQCPVAGKTVNIKAKTPSREKVNPSDLMRLVY